MTNTQRDEIQQAVNVLETTTVKRMDGNGFKAYKVGEVIRVDINNTKEQ
jgi:hypothetical protein